MSLENDLATLALNTESNSKTPLYQQLATHIRQLVQNQRLTSGEQLPSSRKLAQLLNISRTSTLNAYDQLIAEGLLVTRPASGIFVTALGNAIPNKKAPAKKHSSQPPLSMASPTYLETTGIFDAGPDVETFPFTEWSRSLSKVWRRPDPTLLTDSHVGGYWPLRQAITRYIKAVRDIDCQPEQVIITAGSRDTLTLITQALLNKGDPIALENPCYPPLRHGLLAQGASLIHCDVDEQGVQLPPSKVKMAWMTPARQYPLGMPLSIERRIDWLNYSHDNECWLIEDDFDSEFQYRKVPLAPLFNLSSKTLPKEEQRVILAGSFSKLMFKTLRISYLIVPKQLTDHFIATQQKLGSLASVPVQPALADFLLHRRFASHLRKMRSLYQQRRDFLHNELQQKLGYIFTCELPDGGMHLLARLKPSTIDHSDVQLSERFEQQGTYAPALSGHYTGEGEQGLLLGFSGTPEDKLKYGVEQLQKSLK